MMMWKSLSIVMALSVAGIATSSLPAEAEPALWRAGGSCSLQSPITDGAARFVLTTTSSITSKGERRVASRLRVFSTDESVQPIQKLEGASLAIGTMTWSDLKGSIKDSGGERVIALNLSELPSVVLDRLKAASTLRLDITPRAAVVVDLTGSMANSLPYETCLAALPR